MRDVTHSAGKTNYQVYLETEFITHGLPAVTSWTIYSQDAFQMQLDV